MSLETNSILAEICSCDYNECNSNNTYSSKDFIRLIQMSENQVIIKRI